MATREAHYRSFKNSPRLSGSHFLALRRPTRVPESGREYQHGDPVNLIDWKAYARTDTLIVREIRDEASARVRIGLDISETMQWPSPDVPVKPLPPRKADVATRIAFHLAYLHLRMGDLVELWLTTEGKNAAPSARFMPRGPHALLDAFQAILAGGAVEGTMQPIFEPRAYAKKPADLAFWVGDGLSDADARAFLDGPKRSLMVHVLSSLETGIEWIENDTTYFDEGRGRREYQGQALRHRDNYRVNLSRWQDGLREELRRRGGHYLPVTEKTKVSAYLEGLNSFVRLGNTGNHGALAAPPVI